MERFPELYAREMRKWYFKHTGIFSTSTSKHSPQLWEWKSKLKVTHKGVTKTIQDFNTVCVGLDLDKIKFKLDQIGNYSISKVKYVDNQNQIEWMGQGDDFFIKRFNSISNTLPSNKVSDILEQEEIRITKFFTNTLSAKHPDRYILIDKNCIVEVLIHQKAEKDVKEEVRKHCMSIGCTNVSVY
jgi:hypothetical protein